MGRHRTTNIRLEKPQLPDLVHDRIMEEIGRGFGRQLPSERALSGVLGVSRPTVRLALQRLEAEGVVEASGPRGERFVRRGVRETRTPGVRRVRLLQQGSTASFTGEHLLTLKFLSDYLHERGGQFSVETNPGCFNRQPAKALGRLVSTHPADLWILYRSNRAMQEWFVRERRPCLVLGSAWEGTGLPSIDVDYAAVCRHAAGIFIARGHRSLAVIHPENPPRGDANGVEAFLQAAAAGRRGTVPARAHAHDSTVPGICALVDRLVRARARPDGWLIFGVDTFLTVAGRLAEKGVVPGGAVSLICHNHDPLFSSLTPSPAHYRRDLRQMHRLIAAALRAAPLYPSSAPVPLLIPSNFHDGGTLARRG